MKKILSSILSAAMLISALPVMAADDVAATPPDSLVITNAGDTAGNIFVDGEDIVIDVAFKNNTENAFLLDVDYQVVNYEGDLITEGEKVKEVASSKEEIISFDIPEVENNTYNLKLVVADTKSDVKKNISIPFSQITDVPNNNESIFGTCTHFGQFGDKGDDHHVLLPIAKKAGVKWIRDEVYWSYIETEKGKIEVMDLHDEYIDTALANGINVLICLGYANQFYDNGKPPQTQEGYEAFGRYAATVAEHFKGRVSHFEIWNEYNGMQATRNLSPENYARMLKVAYDAIKNVNPEATVICGGVITADVAWVERVIKEIGIEYMDALALHPYGYPSNPEGAGFENSMTSFHKLAKKYGKDMEAWATEYGYPTYVDCVSEDIGGAYISRAHIISSATYPNDKIFKYDLMNDGTTANGREHNFGLVRHYKTVVPFSAKQNYVAYAAAASNLTDAKIEKKVPLTDNTVLYSFNKNDNKMLTLWTLGGKENVSLNVGTDVVTVTDYLGNSKQTKTNNGIVTVIASEYPVYIEGAITKTEGVSAPIYPENTPVDVEKGKNAEIVLKNSLSGVNAIYEFTAPKGWTVIGDTKVEPGQNLFEVIIPEETKIGMYELEVDVNVDGINAGSMLVSINIQTPLDIKVSPMTDDTENWKDWEVQFIIKNNSQTQTHSGKLEFDRVSDFENGQAISEREKPNAISFENLKPGEAKILSVDVNPAPDAKMFEYAGKVKLNDGTEYPFSKRVSFLAAVRNETTPVIDGVFDEEEWKGAMSYPIETRGFTETRYDGEDDRNGVGYVKWDDDYLYLLIDFKDDVHNQPNVGASTWSADGIQWNFDPKRIDGYGVKNHHEFGLALRNDGAVDHYRWLAIAGRQGGAFNDDFNVAKKKAEAVITRYEETKTTLYEAAYPWNELLPEGDKAQHGSLYGFSIILNDDDGSGREGWLSYIDRDIIGRSKSADRFADLLLIDSRGKEEVSFPEKYNWVKADFNLLKKDGIITEDASEELLGGKVTVEEFLNKLYLVTGEEITMSDVNKALVRMGMMNTMNNVFISRGRYQNSDEYALLDAFEDCKNLSDADKQTVVNLVAQGLIQGSNGYIRSEEFTTYAEMVAVLSRIKNNL